MKHKPPPPPKKKKVLQVTIPIKQQKPGVQNTSYVTTMHIYTQPKKWEGKLKIKKNFTTCHLTLNNNQPPLAAQK